MKRLSKLISVIVLALALFGSGETMAQEKIQRQDRSLQNQGSKIGSALSSKLGAEKTPQQANVDPRGSHNGHDYVDLGLPSGTLWATCNVGAKRPGDYGNYYSWGETNTKSSYYSTDSKWYYTDVSKLKSWDVIDNNLNLTSNNDAASTNWGGQWRMPSLDEAKELIENCTWTWTTQDGHEGYKATGPNGNSIFMPAGGWRYSEDFGNVGTHSFFWTATAVDGDSYYFSNSMWEPYGRHSGRNVRPVLSPNSVGRAQAPRQGQGNVAPEGSISGHGYVDLGLPSGTLWATCNVGGNRPTDKGNYYSWGEPQTKAKYTGDNCQWYLVPRYEMLSQGVVDSNDVLRGKYDMATANWGDSWRMPTLQEFQELFQLCTWQWTNIDGRDGYRVTGPNGYSIFIPNSGFTYDGTDFTYGGKYWTATMYDDDFYGAYFVEVTSDSHKIDKTTRPFAHAVRPVAVKKAR